MYSVMIVDDEQLIRRSLYKMISESPIGFTVVGEAEDGLAAFEQACSLTPDLILTDIKMPVMGGMDFIRNSRTANLDCQFIVLSGYGEFELAQEALRYGVADYLLKPIRPEQLEFTLVKMKTALDHKRNAWMDYDLWLVYYPNAAKRMADCIWHMDEIGIHHELSQFYAQWIEGAHKYPSCKDRCVEYVSWVLKNLQNYGGAELNQPNLYALRSAKNGDTIHKLTESLLTEWMNVIRTKRNHGAYHTIKQAAAFMEKNYMDKELSLQSVADYVRLSPSYVSQIFKEAMGASFVQYLIQIRMEQSKCLLSNPHSKTYEVAEAVGYEDYPHFTKTFKKYYGISPREFRNRQGLE
ncbi:response regulator [Paenibacillus sp. FSL H7-0331]|uniref:response regulator transcription factor n=1 Tax=Paenibacillus sp. FSL H7-0331 TaxID=1920421 RepID=UPI00096F2929|nr:response regulator [Paenibacillus sp. FSL H7-0331]OMF20556.1 hypothetical protein BK127_00420 [Paenibacillus sp. FSL H7-0331]